MDLPGRASFSSFTQNLPPPPQAANLSLELNVPPVLRKPVLWCLPCPQNTTHFFFVGRTQFLLLNHVSESLFPHLCSTLPSLQQEPAVSAPFRLDLPEQEPPHPTLGPYLSHSCLLPPTQHWGPGDGPNQVRGGRRPHAYHPPPFFPLVRRWGRRVAQSKLSPQNI